MSVSALKAKLFILHYSRDSFDRFGDDLCEELLSYLSFDSKIVFECVANQWMRTIHNRQTLLRFHYRNQRTNHYKNRVNDFEPHSVPFVLTNNAEDDRKRLICLLKKYTNIETIDLRYAAIERSVIEVLADYCQRLTALSVRGMHLSDEVIQDLCLKIYHIVRRLRLDYCPFHPAYELFLHFTRLETLRRLIQ